jgi:hypothetical protein
MLAMVRRNMQERLTRQHNKVIIMINLLVFHKGTYACCLFNAAILILVKQRCIKNIYTCSIRNDTE